MAQAEQKVADSDAFEDIRRAVIRRYGTSAKIDNIVVATLGGSNRTVIFDLIESGTSRRLVSRQETYTGEEQAFITTANQFRIMQVVYKHDFPVPEPVFEYDETDDMGNGFVTAFASGETMPKKIIHGPAFADLRPRLAARCGELLAQLHAIDRNEFSFLENWLDSVDTLAAFRDRYDFYAELHPAIEFGFRWLERNRAPDVQKRLVHSDFRCGNLMVGPDDVSAVLDWECSHLGAPMEDLGWLCMRSWRFDRPDLPVGGFGERNDLYEAYHAAGGDKVDPDVVRYWEIFGLVRWAIYNIMQAHGHITGARRSLAFAACGRNTCLVEYDLLMTLKGHYS